MGNYEDQDRVQNYVKNISTDGYFRILYVYVYGENGYFEIRVELEKLPGWEGYYSESIYREQLNRLESVIRYDVVYSLGYHTPRVYFDLRN